MRRLTLVMSAVVVAACASGATSVPLDDASATPNRMGETFVMPTRQPTPDTTVTPADVSSWLMIAPVGQGFGVAMPGQPNVSSTVLAGYSAPTTVWTYTDPAGRSYQVARSRLPEESVSNDPAAMLDMLKDTPLQLLVGSSFLSRTDAMINGLPAIRFVLRSAGKRAQGLVVVDDDILYRVCVTYEPDSPDEGSLMAFLGSFTVTA